MKITVGKNREIQLEEVYSGVLLKTNSGEELGICMRDSGFEFNYQGTWYSAQNGVIKKDEPILKGNVLVDQSDPGGSVSSGT